MILLAAASAAVLVASLAMVAQMKPRGALASLLALGLFAWAIVSLTVGVAGLLLRDLSPTTLLVLALVWPTAVVLFARYRGHPVTSLWASIASALAVPRGTVNWPPVAIALVIVGVSLAWRTVLAVRLPVVDLLGWQYHLVFVDVWLQSNALVRVTQNVWTDGWPATGELLTTWLAAFTRTDALTGFTSLLPIPIAMVATSGLARFLGAGRRAALLAGLLLGMMPAIVALAGTTYLDTAMAAAVTAAWWLGLRVLSGERDGSTAVLFGISAGLALGIKGTSLVLVTPILLAVVAVLVRDALGGQGAARLKRSGWMRPALVLAPVLVLAGSWYVKNLLTHGNPLYPVAVGPLSGLAPGSYGAPPAPLELVGLSWLDQIIRSWTFDWQLVAYEYNVRAGGFGLAWLAVLGLALVGLTLLVRARQLAALALVVGPALVAFAALTSPWYARYTLFIASLALTLAARAIQSLGTPFRFAASGSLVGLASISLVLANTSPNIEVPLGPSAGFSDYATFVLTASDSERSNIDRREKCARLAIIPRGARVVVQPEFMVPHAAVGPNLDRILTEPTPRGLASVEALVAAMEARGAEWLVTHPSGAAQALAAASPNHFVLRDRTCMRGIVWEFVPSDEASSQTR
jgi:hypothetical protein